MAQPRGSWTLDATDQLHVVREGLRAEIGNSKGPTAHPFALADPTERVLLVATELAGNALRHAAPPVEVHLSRSAGGWIVLVTDSRPQLPPRPAASPTKDGGGRGLVIVDTLSVGTGWSPDGDSKSVWAFVPDEPPPRLVETLRPYDLG
ncbi:MAG TPA: ATP-binding protein [Actinomycetales bacterium]|nr:ATP-binding protein [Actinomycetales bacterium]